VWSWAGTGVGHGVASPPAQWTTPTYRPHLSSWHTGARTTALSEVAVVCRAQTCFIFPFQIPKKQKKQKKNKNSNMPIVSSYQE